jgi:ParB family chromosome partitioning protein
MANNEIKHILLPYNDLFKSTVSTVTASGESVQILKISELQPFPNHPFKVVDDEDMRELTALIKAQGIITPIIARPLAGGGYQIISGHRRVRAAGLAGLESVPALIKDIGDNEAVIIMSASNKQRKNALPSELAYSYKMHYEALKKQAGARTDLTGGEGGATRDIVAEKMGVSSATLGRYIKLTALMPGLMALLDSKKLSVGVGYLLADLNEDGQQALLDFIINNKGIKISEVQAAKLKAESGKTPLDENIIGGILRYKKPGIEKIRKEVKIPYKKIQGFFPSETPAKDVEDLIVSLLSEYFKNLKREEMPEIVKRE